jgi:hypothetical protein
MGVRIRDWRAPEHGAVATEGEQWATVADVQEPWYPFSSQPEAQATLDRTEEVLAEWAAEDAEWAAQDAAMDRVWRHMVEVTSPAT